MRAVRDTSPRSEGSRGHDLPAMSQVGGCRYSTMKHSYLALLYTVGNETVVFFSHFIVLCFSFAKKNKKIFKHNKLHAYIFFISKYGFLPC